MIRWWDQEIILEFVIFMFPHFTFCQVPTHETSPNERVRHFEKSIHILSCSLFISRILASCQTTSQWNGHWQDDGHRQCHSCQSCGEGWMITEERKQSCTLSCVLNHTLEQQIRNKIIQSIWFSFFQQARVLSFSHFILFLLVLDLETEFKNLDKSIKKFT